MGAHAATPLEFRELERCAEFEERVATNHSAQERRVGPEESVDGSENGGEIVDPVERGGGEGSGEGVSWVWEVGGVTENAFFVDTEAFEFEGGGLGPWFGVVAVEESGGGVGAGEFVDAWDELGESGVGEDGFGDVAGA